MSVATKFVWTLPVLVAYLSACGGSGGSDPDPALDTLIATIEDAQGRALTGQAQFHVAPGESGVVFVSDVCDTHNPILS